MSSDHVRHRRQQVVIHFITCFYRRCCYRLQYTDTFYGKLNNYNARRQHAVNIT